jgi:hypothetical protein
MADFRALCAELVDAIDSGISTDRMHLSPVMLRTRAALTEPEPVAPTDEELAAFFEQHDWNYISPETFFEIARAVLDTYVTH